MCYEGWYQKKREMDELEKAKKDADAVIEQARATSRKPAETKKEPSPVAEAEKETA